MLKVKEAGVKTVIEESGEDSKELIAVITAAIAAGLNTSAQNMVVRRIVRVGDRTPIWGRVGRIEQMNRSKILNK